MIRPAGLQQPSARFHVVLVQQLSPMRHGVGATIRPDEFLHASTMFQTTGIGDRGVGSRFRISRNCPLRIRWISSIPAIVLAALAKILKPGIGP